MLKVRLYFFLSIYISIYLSILKHLMKLILVLCELSPCGIMDSVDEETKVE